MAPSDGVPALQSIRKRLLRSLVSVLLLLVATAAIVSYWVALRAANDAYDRSLLDPALELARNVRIENGTALLDLPPKAQETLVYDQADKVVFQIRDAQGNVVAGVDDLAPIAGLASEQRKFVDGMYGEEPVRIAALRTPDGLVIQVGETLHKRQLLVWEILAAELVPTLLIAAASIALAWASVTHGLVPLARVHRELLGRSPHDLRPLADTAAPMELAPVVGAFNRLLAQLHEASALQKRFLANAAHQLRTPLAGLQMHLEILLRREHPADVRNQLERLHQASVRAGHLAIRLLALARAESSAEGHLALQEVDLREIANAAAREWVPMALARSIDLGFALEPARVTGDALLIAELLDNLVDNALRYTPRDGSVTLRCGADEGRAYLCVEDTGPGIAPEERERVVERFYRVSGSPGDGSGLGLAIVKEVVDRHGAVLAIDNGAHGRGTRMTVTFPESATRHDSDDASPAQAVERTPITH